MSLLLLLELCGFVLLVAGVAAIVIGCAELSTALGWIVGGVAGVTVGGLALWATNPSLSRRDGRQ